MWITSSSSVALVLNECPLAQRSSTQTVQVCPGRNVATDAQLRYGWRDRRFPRLIGRSFLSPSSMSALAAYWHQLRLQATEIGEHWLIRNH